jgi:hypothetical protein
VLYIFYELQLLYTYTCLSQKHSPSGIIELKDVRRVTDINGDGVFRVETPFRTYDIKGETIEEAQGWIKAVREALTVLESQP